jgi:hypothetical protein
MSKQKQLVSQQIPSPSKDEIVRAIMRIQSLPEDVVFKTLSAKGTLTKNTHGKLIVGKKV